MYSDAFNFNQIAIIKRRSLVADGYGGNSYTTANIASVPCAIWLNTGSRSRNNDRLSYLGSHSLACKPSTGFLVTDYVVNQGTTYRVLSVDNISYENEILIIGMEMSDKGMQDG